MVFIPCYKMLYMDDFIKLQINENTYYIDKRGNVFSKKKLKITDKKTIDRIKEALRELKSVL